jgi:hypothetical protein
MVSKETADELVEILENHSAYMYGDCERCLSGKITARGHRTTLVGGFETKLCPSCTREWDRFCDKTVEYKELVYAEYEKDAVKLLIKSGKDLRVDLVKAVGTAMKANTVMDEIAESWVKRTRER